MSKNWSKWGFDYIASVGRHIGTAGMTWVGLGLKEGKVDWHSLWIAVLVGAILPSTFTFLQRTPVPEDANGPTPAPVLPSSDKPNESPTKT